MTHLRNAFALAAALAALAPAFADIPPPEPENPISETCQPFIGVWARDVPTHSRRQYSWQVVAIDSNSATILSYANQDNVNIEASALDFTLTCAKEGDAVKLVFEKEGWGSYELAATPLGDDGFTTTEMSQDLSNGAPDPNFKPEPILVTWKRIAR